MPPPFQVEPGRRPTRRSVPGPSRWMASNRRSFSAPQARFSSSIRSDQAATGSSVSRRQTIAISSHSRSSAASGSMSGCTSVAQPSVGHGTIDQLLRASVMFSFCCFAPGGRSRPIRSGSIPSSSPGATGPLSAIVAPCLAPC